MRASHLNQCWVSVGGGLTLMGKNHWFWFWELQTGSKSGVISEPEPEPEFVCLFSFFEEPDPKPYSWFYLCVELKLEHDAVSKE
jgi:hypothetical protein